MTQRKKVTPGSLQRILLIAAACSLISGGPTCFASEGTRGMTRAGFNAGDYRVRGISALERSGAQAWRSAIIESVKTGKQDLYRPGDIISGARINRIEENSVTLVVEQEKYVLRLERMVSGKAAATAHPPRSLTPGVVMLPPISRRVHRPPGPIVPEPTPESLMKTIEQEQREHPR